MTQRRVVETGITQGEDESIAYVIDTSLWGGSPSSSSVAVKDKTNAYADVTSATTTGSASEDGDDITTPRIESLTAGHTYRVECSWTDSDSNVQETWFEIRGEV